MKMFFFLSFFLTLPAVGFGQAAVYRSQLDSRHQDPTFDSVFVKPRNDGQAAIERADSMQNDSPALVDGHLTPVEAAKLSVLVDELEREGGNGGAVATRLREEFTRLGTFTVRGRVLSLASEGLLVACSNETDDPSPICYITGTPKKVWYDGAPVDATGVILLQGIPDPQKWADGDPICIIATRADEVFRYTNTGGAAATVHIYHPLTNR